MSDSENQYTEVRCEKLRRLREMGANPYLNGVAPEASTARINAEHETHDAAALARLDRTFSIAGRLMAVRSFGKSAFVKVKDATGHLQVFVRKDGLSEHDFAVFKLLDVGDIAWFEGRLFRTKTGELTLEAQALRLVTKCVRPLPEKWHGLTDIEARYRQRYVDLIVNPQTMDTFLMRSRITQAIRDIFNERGFLEVETPMMHPIPGGAAAKPFVTHHNKLDVDLYLRIAPELYLKRLLVGGMERVYEINRNFRNEGISIQHNPEFTMLEFYRAYATYEDLMVFTEEMLGDVAQRVLGTTSVIYQGETVDFAGPYERHTLKDSLVTVGGLDPAVLSSREAALAYAEGLGDELKSKNEGLGAILTEIFEIVVEPRLIRPTFITQYPTEVSPLARKSDADPSVTDRFELFIYGREIANGFSELNDPADQAIRFRAQVDALYRGDEEAMHFDEDYIRALEYGMPPAAGEGIGIDRLVMLMTDSASIRDVILFPQLKPVTKTEDRKPEAPMKKE